MELVFFKQLEASYFFTSPPTSDFGVAKIKWRVIDTECNLLLCIIGWCYHFFCMKSILYLYIVFFFWIIVEQKKPPWCSGFLNEKEKVKMVRLLKKMKEYNFVKDLMILLFDSIHQYYTNSLTRLLLYQLKK